jgi:hypothetical protein
MDAFVGWLYSGRLDRRVNQKLSCLLWVFGKKFGVPLLHNDAILLLCDNIRRGVLRVSTVNYVYNNTEAESPLRLFIAEYFTHVNPLSPSLTESWNVEKTKFYKAEWVKLIADRGYFIKVARFSLHNDNK